jgi:hypothetical protein
MQSLTLSILKNLSSHFAATLQNSADYNFVGSAFGHSRLSHFGAFIFVHKSGLTADEGFVYFDVPLHFCQRAILESQPDTMSKEPCGFLRDSNRAMNLVAADSVLIVTDHPNSAEPFIQPDCALFHDGSNLDAELPPYVFIDTLPKTARLEEMNFFAATSRTDHNTIRPAFLGQIRKAVVDVAEICDCLLERFRFFDLACHENRVAGLFA